MYTKKNLIFVIGRYTLISFGVVLCTSIIIMFLSNQITKISDSVVQNKKLANKLAERTNLLDKLKQDVDVVGNGDVLINNAFVPTDNIIDFISALESLAIRNSVIQAPTFNSPTETTISAPFPVNIINYHNSLSGTISTFIKYTKDFEKLSYFTKINGFNISSQSPLGIEGASTVSFDATLYTKTIQ